MRIICVRTCVFCFTNVGEIWFVYKKKWVNYNGPFINCDYKSFDRVCVSASPHGQTAHKITIKRKMMMIHIHSAATSQQQQKKIKMNSSIDSTLSIKIVSGRHGILPNPTDFLFFISINAPISTEIHVTLKFDPNKIKPTTYRMYEYSWFHSWMWKMCTRDDIRQIKNNVGAKTMRHNFEFPTSSLVSHIAHPKFVVPTTKYTWIFFWEQEAI